MRYYTTRLVFLLSIAYALHSNTACDLEEDGVDAGKTIQKTSPRTDFCKAVSQSCGEPLASCLESVTKEPCAKSVQCAKSTTDCQSTSPCWQLMENDCVVDAGVPDSAGDNDSGLMDCRSCMQARCSAEYNTCYGDADCVVVTGGVDCVCCSAVLVIESCYDAEDLTGDSADMYQYLGVCTCLNCPEECAAACS